MLFGHCCWPWRYMYLPVFCITMVPPEGGFSSVYRELPEKPMVTLLFGIWGVTFQFAGVMSLLIGNIFFSKEDKKDTDCPGEI